MEQELRKLGLSEYESKVYLTLVRYGSLEGRKLSKLSSVPQSKIYEVLYRLAEKKFVLILEVKPKLFKAIEPRTAIKNFLLSKKQEIETLGRTIPNKLKSLKKFVEPQTSELITVYRGEKNTHPLVINKFITAKKYVKDMFTFEYMPNSVLREVIKCIEKGVKIYMLATKKDEDNIKLIRKIKKLGVEVRYFPVKAIRLAIKDGVESYQMIVNPKNMLDRVSIVIESNELTKALEHYFDYLWQKAKIIK